MKFFIGGSLVLIAALLAISWYWIAHKVTVRGDLTRVGAPLVIFDFDGTICPSYPLFIDQINFFADEYHLKKISDEDVENYRSMTPKSIMKDLGVSSFKLPFLLRKIRKNVQTQLLGLKPVPGIIEVLQELKSRGYSLGILTSNSEENVLLYLQKYEINFFDFIYAGNNVFGKDKHLSAILLKTRLDSEKERVVYVGDEIRDMEAAKKTNLIGVGVTWGYNSQKLLRQSNPDYLCEGPSQLHSLINTVHTSPETEQLIFSNQE